MPQSDHSKKNKKHIGILGGAFNPAHHGHLYISEKALEILSLDEIWWLVSYKHPTKKNTHNDNNFAERIKYASDLIKKHNKIKISNFEQISVTSYTIDTLNLMIQRYPNHQLIWIMGEDNLINFHTWYNWQEIIKLIPILIVSREHNAGSYLNSKFYQLFKEYQTFEINEFKNKSNLAWYYLNIPVNTISSSKIRDNNI